MTGSEVVRYSERKNGGWKKWKEICLDIQGIIS